MDQGRRVETLCTRFLASSSSLQQTCLPMCEGDPQEISAVPEGRSSSGSALLERLGSAVSIAPYTFFSSLAAQSRTSSMSPTLPWPTASVGCCDGAIMPRSRLEDVEME